MFWIYIESEVRSVLGQHSHSNRGDVWVGVCGLRQLTIPYMDCLSGDGPCARHTAWEQQFVNRTLHTKGFSWQETLLHVNVIYPWHSHRRIATTGGSGGSGGRTGGSRETPRHLRHLRRG